MAIIRPKRFELRLAQDLPVNHLQALSFKLETVYSTFGEPADASVPVEAAATLWLCRLSASAEYHAGKVGEGVRFRVRTLLAAISLKGPVFTGVT